MSTISPELTAAVNALPSPLQGPFLAVMTQLSEVFASADRTTAAFAESETAVVKAILDFGVQSTLALVQEFGAHSDLIRVGEGDDALDFQRLEPSNLDVVTVFGRGTTKRSLFRQIGVRNGPTVDPATLRCGLVHHATPKAAKMIGAFIAAVPSREALKLLQQVGIRSLSRATIERVAQAYGERLEEHRDELDSALIEEVEIPEEATAVSVSVDRVSVAMEEPKTRKRGRPKKGAAKRPIDVVYRMAYVFCWTLHDCKGEPLYTARGGRMPYDGADDEVIERLRWDVMHLKGLRPDLRIAALSDGAPEMIRMLRQVTGDFDVDVQLVDVWHALEYVAAAALALKKESKAEVRRAKKDLFECDDGAQRVIARMKRWKTALRKAKRRVPKALSDAIRYISNKNHDGLMQYAGARRFGLPVGSGTVEATAKTLVSIRMKRSGARWKEASGQHVLTLRSQLLSDRWDEVGAWHVAKNDNQIPAIREVA